MTKDLKKPWAWVHVPTNYKYKQFTPVPLYPFPKELEQAAQQGLQALDNLARYADECELILQETHPGKAASLRERVTASIEAITALRKVLPEPYDFYVESTEKFYDTIFPKDSK